MEVTLLKYGKLLCNPNWEADWRDNFHHKIYYCIAGSAYYILGEERVKLEKGCFYIFPIFSRCRIVHDANDPFEVIWAHINTNPPLGNTITKVSANSGFYKYIADALETGMSKGDGTTKHLLGALMEACIADDILEICADESIAWVLNYINNNIGEKLTNEQLSAKISYSKNHFINLFKQHTTMSPHMYIKLLRLEKARAHLQQGKTVKDTAVLCGFSSSSALSREIKLHFGVCASSL